MDQLEYVVNAQPTLSQVLVKTENGQSTLYVYALGLIGAETEGRYHSYHFDYRGSTVALTDEQAQVVQRFAYGPYGELLSGDAALTLFLFNGMFGVMSEGNGLYFMRARFYSPQVKRFVNQDPLVGTIVQGQSLNRFAFVSGRPVSFVDPFGLAQKDLNRAIDIVKTFMPPIYSDNVEIRFGNTFKWWNPRHWWYQFTGDSIDGYTTFGNPITILIDEDFSRVYITRNMDGSRRRVPRIRDLLESVVHEYQHAFDYQNWNRYYYNYVIMLFTRRHSDIYSYSKFIALLFEKYMYLTEEEWQVIKKNVKEQQKHMTKECYSAW